MTLKLTGSRYTPDIGVVTPDRELWLVEVKAGWNFYRSGRDSKRALRTAAAEFPWLARFWSLLPAEGAVHRSRAGLSVAGWDLKEYTQ